MYVGEDSGIKKINNHIQSNLISSPEYKSNSIVYQSQSGLSTHKNKTPRKDQVIRPHQKQNSEFEPMPLMQSPRHSSTKKTRNMPTKPQSHLGFISSDPASNKILQSNRVLPAL